MAGERAAGEDWPLRVRAACRAAGRFVCWRGLLEERAFEVALVHWRAKLGRFWCWWCDADACAHIASVREYLRNEKKDAA